MCLELNNICFLILLHFITYFYFLICEVAQSCPTLCDLMGCNLPGSSVHGIIQARVLELVAISSSRGCEYILVLLLKPFEIIMARQRIV